MLVNLKLLRGGELVLEFHFSSDFGNAYLSGYLRLGFAELSVLYF